MFDETDSKGRNRRKMRRSQAQERRLAADTGGRVTPASGALWGYKGDVQTDYAIIEAKRTDGKGLRVQGEWLAKVEREAASKGLDAVIELEIDGHVWHAMPSYVHLELREQLGRPR